MPPWQLTTLPYRQPQSTCTVLQQPAATKVTDAKQQQHRPLVQYRTWCCCLIQHCCSTCKVACTGMYKGCMHRHAHRLCIRMHRHAHCQKRWAPVGWGKIQSSIPALNYVSSWQQTGNCLQCAAPAMGCSDQQLGCVRVLLPCADSAQWCFCKQHNLYKSAALIS